MFLPPIFLPELTAAHSRLLLCKSCVSFAERKTTILSTEPFDVSSEIEPINKDKSVAGLTMINQHSVEIRVRYAETDAMGFLHHSNYLSYFEVGRTELFRAQGGSYRRMEELGLYFVVAKIEVRYRRPARYDDQLTLKTEIARVTPAKLEHHYCLMRENEVLTEADSIIACVNRAGEVQRIPENLVGMTTLKDHL